MRRGQAALEFLTTYGWAFLIILVMIGAISYFGILNPSKFLPERCTTAPEFPCNDFKIGSDGNVSMVLKQTIGKTIYLNNVTCTYEGIPQTTQYSTVSWSPKNTVTVGCLMPGTTNISKLKGQKIKATFDINYQLSSTSSLTHIASGEVFATVQ